jgi:hypothetical protein
VAQNNGNDALEIKGNVGKAISSRYHMDCVTFDAVKYEREPL